MLWTIYSWNLRIFEIVILIKKWKTVLSVKLRQKSSSENIWGNQTTTITQWNWKTISFKGYFRFFSLIIDHSPFTSINYQPLYFVQIYLTKSFSLYSFNLLIHVPNRWNKLCVGCKIFKACLNILWNYALKG